MISYEAIKNLATRYQSSEFPNIIREYFQHLFLSNLYKIKDSPNIFFKGGTALRLIYGSPRFSEDLDFSAFNIPPYRKKDFIENLFTPLESPNKNKRSEGEGQSHHRSAFLTGFTKVLAEIEMTGIKVDLGAKPGPTKKGYYADASFRIYDYPPVAVSINVSTRNGRKITPEIETIASDFVPTYNLYRLPQELLIEEKIDALLGRKKARDFYDIYYIMRKGLLTLEQKKRLVEVRNLAKTFDIDYKTELSVFLPQDQQAIIKEFKTVLLAELKRQIG